MQCACCRFYQGVSVGSQDVDAKFECHRFPRVPVVVDGELVWSYPIQVGYDYCGEFKAVR